MEQGSKWQTQRLDGEIDNDLLGPSDEEPNQKHKLIFCLMSVCQ